MAIPLICPPASTAPTDGAEPFVRDWWLYLYNLGVKQRAVPPSGPYIDPVAYGAVGDGVTDDSLAWTDALAAAVATGLPIFGGGRTYLVSRQGSYTLAWDASTHHYVFLLADPVVVTDSVFTMSIADADVATIFVFQATGGVRFLRVSAIGTGTPATLSLYEGALVAFDRCADCQVVESITDNMRGNTLFFQGSDGEVSRSFSSVPSAATRLYGSHFASYGCSRVTIRDCTGYGGTGDGDITHFGTNTDGLATGNRTLNCSLYNYEYGDTSKTIVNDECQGFLLDSGQEFGIIAHCYAYGFYYGVDIKTTGEGNVAHDNTMEKCKISYTARRGEGNAPTYNTIFHHNLARPLGGNGNAVVIGGITTTVCFWIQDSPGTVLDGNMTEASYLFGAGEQEFVSVVGEFSDATFVYSAIDGPWIRNNQFMQVMNIGGIYTYSKNAAVFLNGTAIALLRRGCVSGNDFKIFADSAMSYYPLSVTYAERFTISENHFSVRSASAHPNISAANCTRLTISGNTHEQAAGFIILASCDIVKIANETFGNGLRYAATPVPAIYGATVTNVVVSGCTQDQISGSDNGRFFETSASGNASIVLSGNILNLLIFTVDWYKVNGIALAARQDVSVCGNVLNGRLALGSEYVTRNYAIRATGGNWVLDGTIYAAHAAATSQDILLGDELPPRGKILFVNFTPLDAFSGTGFTAVSATLGDQSGTDTWYTSVPFDLMLAGGADFRDFTPLHASVNQTGSNIQVTITANQNLNANALTGAFMITIGWIQIAMPTFTV